MNTTEILSTVAVIVSAFAFALSLLIFRTTLTRLSVKITLYKNDASSLALTLINESDKSISFLGVTFYQDDKVCVGKFSNYVLKNLDAPTASIVVYLEPYEAAQVPVNIKFDEFDKSRLIRMRFKTSRRTLSYWLDFSKSDNPVVYKHCYYCKHNSTHR